MKTVFFIVKIPIGYHKFSISRHHKSTIIERIETIDAGKKSKNIIARSIKPNQLVYVVKEFNLLNHFRRKVYRFLKYLNRKVVFYVVEPNNGGLIDYAW